MTNRDDIVTCARQFIGVRFIHQGRSVEGLDCLGLLLMTAAAANLTFDEQHVKNLDVPTYGRRPDTILLKQKLERFLIPIPSEELKPADIILINIQNSPQHLAILSDYPLMGHLGMIHAYAPARKVVEHRYDLLWRRDTYATYRLPQLA